jgi:outer membrane protein assembly factor BamB
MFPDGEAVETIVGNQEPLFDSEETMITFMNKKAIRKFNAKSGELIWETEVKAKEVSAPRNGYAPMILSENKETLYAAYVKKSLIKWYGIVCGISTSDGNMIWKKPVKFKGGVTEMQQTAQGLIVKGVPIDEEGLPKTDQKPFFALLDPMTGKTLWKKEYNVLTDGSDFVVRDNDILVYANGKLLTVNLSDGMPFEIGKDLKFKGKETPTFIDIRDDGIFLQSSNNLMLVSLMGEKVYHAYHEAPGFKWWEKMAGLAGSMAAASYMKADDISGATEFIFTERFKATSNLETYTCMLAHIESGNKKEVGLVKVNKKNGSVENQIVLGTRLPTYAVDEYESLLFFKSDKREIVCYRF